ncbi:bb3-type cytochrome oxidase subunit III [[Empedobacter] haloabium]|uniref:Bb3-type cytochrome oxidase subunit III n=1 Tax=[Empedobacter] haloabium TaxID=592317 RepID=A0ABZ1UH65_9BURK
MKAALLSALTPALRPAPFQPATGEWGGVARHSAAQVGLWTFMVVVCMLFLLFGIAYMMRIGYGDWRAPPAVPWQLWLSTALLAGASVAWQIASWRAVATQRWCLLGLLCALAFVLSQLSAWRVLAAQGYAPAASPGAGFFYMLTGLHGLHVAGGIVAAVLVMGQPGCGRAGPGDAGPARTRVSLCSQYWHLLLILWLALFTLLFRVTPGLVQDFCAAVGIGGR